MSYLFIHIFLENGWQNCLKIPVVPHFIMFNCKKTTVKIMTKITVLEEVLSWCPLNWVHISCPEIQRWLKQKTHIQLNNVVCLMLSVYVCRMFPHISVSLTWRVCLGAIGMVHKFKKKSLIHPGGRVFDINYVTQNNSYVHLLAMLCMFQPLFCDLHQTSNNCFVKLAVV